MKLQKKKTIMFTICCILFLSGIILFQTFATYKNQNIIKEDVESVSGTEFAFFVDDTPSDKIPKKSIGYSLNTYKSKCYDPSTGNQVSNVSWDNEKWKVILKNIANTKTKCDLYFDQIYIDKTLKKENDENSIGPIPDLGNGRLVPIKIEIIDNQPVVKKASIFEEWYNYGERKWANAVILKDDKIDNYEPNTVINEDDIESYFVWIPRFEYQLWNGEEETNAFSKAIDLGLIEDSTTVDELNKAREIQIHFVTNTDEVHNGMNKDEWLTHPAFTSFNSNGMWVGKFETSKNGTAVNDSISPEAVQIKPNITSWKNIRVAHAFYTTYNYKRELDSHMMKNIEWGAVAYFTNSQYGRCDGNGTCSVIRINNNNSFITGSSAVTAPTCGYTTTNIDCHKYGTTPDVVLPYNNPKSVASSTTDNYYGIYDMAGGSLEYVMGVMLDRNGKPASGRHNIWNSNFVGTLTCPNCETNANKSKTEWTAADGGLPWPDSKYYDTYAYDSTSQNYVRGLFGDGTKEFGPFYHVTYNTGNADETTTRNVSEWNANDALFVEYTNPWIRRDGHYGYGTFAGLAAFGHDYGQANVANTFRVVLTP